MIVIGIGVIAGLLQVIGYVIYAHATFHGRLKPNAASWGLWALGASLESASYIAATDDWVKNILPLVCALSAIFFFVSAFLRGHFQPLDTFEKWVVVLDSIAILIWWHYDSAVYANLYLVLTAFVSFIPIVRHTWKNPKSENATPWFIWTFAYSALAIVVLLRFEKWEDFVYPVSFAFIHAAVGILALDTRMPGTLKFKKIN